LRRSTKEIAEKQASTATKPTDFVAMEIHVDMQGRYDMIAPNAAQSTATDKGGE
jgi:hypothetical protein